MNVRSFSSNGTLSLGTWAQSWKVLSIQKGKASTWVFPVVLPCANFITALIKDTNHLREFFLCWHVVVVHFITSLNLLQINFFINDAYTPSVNKHN